MKYIGSRKQWSLFPIQESLIECRPDEMKHLSTNEMFNIFLPPPPPWLPYQYQPLEPQSNSIRLLQLEPAATREERLCGSLVTRSLTSLDDDLNTHYAALSYVWGDSSQTKIIHLMDGDMSCFHVLTINLYNALINIREKYRAILIWVDAICIDQSNTAERGHQVKLMADIYRSAGCTVIYLGHSCPTFEYTIDFSSRHPEARHNESLQNLDQRAYTVRDLCSREWFNRGWVFQELILSRNPRVQCGKYRAGWQQFQLAIDLAIHDCGNRRGYLGRQHTFHSMVEARDNRLSRTFSQLVISRRNAHVSDPRDYFFCLMGIASDADAVQRVLPIDYSQSVKAVFTKAANYMVDCMGLPAVLDYVDAATIQMGLPSFVPTWGVSSLQAISKDASVQSATPPPSEVDILQTSLVRLIYDGNAFPVQRLSAVMPWGTKFMSLFSKSLESRFGHKKQRISRKNCTNPVRVDWKANVVARGDQEDLWQWFHDTLSKYYPNWGALPEGPRETNFDVSESIFSVIEDTARDLHYGDDGIPTNKRPGCRWAYCGDSIALVPPETEYGDLLVQLKRCPGENSTNPNWFVIRPAEEKLLQTEKDAIAKHICNSPNLGLGSESLRDEEIALHSRYGELKAVARTFHRGRPKPQSQRQPYYMVLV